MILYIVLFIFFIVVFSAAYSSLVGAPWVPTFKKDVARVLALADIKKGEVFFDLGCGDGRLVAAAAKAGAQAYGVELSLLPFIFAKIRTWRLKNAKILYRNLYKADLSQADTVYFFLMPGHNEKIKNKLQKELKAGAKVIAYVWPISGWQPVKMDKPKNKPALYLYVMSEH